MKCLWGHEWTDWAIVDRGNVTYFGDIVGWYLVQERYCLKCGKHSMSDQANYGGAWQQICKRVSSMTDRLPRKDGVKV